MSWEPVETMPEGKYFRTKREGENGENVSCWHRQSEEYAPGDEREYWDRSGYSTVINPGTFAAPTHWWNERYDTALGPHQATT